MRDAAAAATADDEIDTLLFEVNSKPALWMGLNDFRKPLPTVNGLSVEASGFGGVVRICDVPRRYKCGDGDVVLVRDSVSGVVDVILLSFADLFCCSSSKPCGLESTSAAEREEDKVRFNQGSLGSDLRTMRIDFSEELDIYLTTTTTAARGITTAAVGAEDEEGFFCVLTAIADICRRGRMCQGYPLAVELIRER